MTDLHCATVHCEDCDRDIEAYDCVEIDKMIKWLKDHNKDRWGDWGDKGVRGDYLILEPLDYQYLLNWGRG